MHDRFNRELAIEIIDELMRPTLPAVQALPRRSMLLWKLRGRARWLRKLLLIKSFDDLKEVCDANHIDPASVKKVF